MAFTAAALTAARSTAGAAKGRVGRAGAAVAAWVDIGRFLRLRLSADGRRSRDRVAEPYRGPFRRDYGPGGLCRSGNRRGGLAREGQAEPRAPASASFGVRSILHRLQGTGVETGVGAVAILGDETGDIEAPDMGQACFDDAPAGGGPGDVKGD